MNSDRMGLHTFLQHPSQGLNHNPPLVDLMMCIADTVKTLSAMIAQGAIADMTSKLERQNVQGEIQMKLDLLSNDLFIAHLRDSGLVQGLASEEMDETVLLTKSADKAPFIVIFDPLDGSSNVPVNVSVGSIFSILAAPDDHLAQATDYLQAGNQQLAAGYALYGPATMLMLTVGKGTHGFTLNQDSHEFVLTHPTIQIPAETAEFAINASNERFWELPVKRYIDECKQGVKGVRAKDYNMRWVASMVADIHRVLMRGGIYLYPKDSKDHSKAGRLRLMYEANPMAMLVEQAGGLASTGRTSIMNIKPEDVHQRVPIVMGSSSEVQRIERYHHDYDAGNNENDRLPFFSDRSFYMQ
jgi:fructose-1,6-bisphosphatase I / sedoheptulose-1,7-bisphosphatase